MSDEKKLEKGKEGHSDRGLEKASLVNPIELNVAPTVDCHSSNSSSSATSSLYTSSSVESDQHPVAKQAAHHPSTRCYGYDLIYIYPKQIEQVHPQPVINLSNSSRWTLQHQSLKRISKASIKGLSSSGSSSSASSSLNTASTIKGSAQQPEELKGYDLIYRKHHCPSYSRPTLIPSNSSRPILQNQKVLKPLSKVPPENFGSQSNGFMKGCPPMKKCSSFLNQCQEPLPQTSPMGYNQNDRLRDTFNRNRDFESCHETSRGPRSRGGGFVSLSSPAEKDLFGLTVQRDKYNLQTFQTEYEDAMFFVIESYNEEHIHKSIKYDVWSSTAYGNKKLDAAFHDAGRKSSDTGHLCPIFLFFSVNGSGQFVGLAEMLGPVDFEKDMDFWQQNMWNGFFPLKWQIIKDIPNNQLCHIILENNDNKPVTYTRDTQQIGFQQGLEMLSIFKSYNAKTSMLDDFNYYEDREKSKHVHHKAASPQMRNSGNEFPNQFEAGVRKPETSMRTSRISYPKTSLISLARNLSLNPNIRKTSARNDSEEG